MADKRPDLEELKDLVAGLPPASWAARLRALMPIIDRRIREEGLRGPEIIDALNEQAGPGAKKLTLVNFRWALRQHRRRMRAEGGSKVATAPPTAAGATALPSEEQSGSAPRGQAEAGPAPLSRDASPGPSMRSVTRDGGAPIPRTNGGRLPDERGAPVSKADLKRARSQDVDLDALAKLAADDGEER